MKENVCKIFRNASTASSYTPCRWKPQQKIKLISLRRGRSEKKHFEINDFLNFIVAHSFSINCRGSVYVTGFHGGHLLCNIQDRDFYIMDVDKYEIKDRGVVCACPVVYCQSEEFRSN